MRSSAGSYFKRPSPSPPQPEFHLLSRKRKENGNALLHVPELGIKTLVNSNCGAGA